MSFNPDKQHTLASPVSISGTGLHTGMMVDMTLNPAEPDYGIYFQRVDLPDKPKIKANCDFVTDTNRGTTLEANGVKVNTVEHIMAALAGMGVDNALITLTGPEIPIMDGSAQAFVEKIVEAGIEEQEVNKTWFILDDNITLYDEEKRVEMIALPAEEYQLTTLIDFNSPVLGTQHASLKSIRDFKTDIAPCRTFCFLHELEALLDNNLIRGGDINNAIVVVDKTVSEEEMQRLAKAFNRDTMEIKNERYLNNLELRFTNEPARHKLLDIIGDLALIGYPLKARIIANRPGHSTNITFARKIKKHIKRNEISREAPMYDPSKPPVMSLPQIQKMLPHRFPFLLVDKIVELSETHIIGIKNVTYNEWFFQGHFPGNPIMPGVMQLEALAQTGGIFCIHSMPPGKYDTYFLKINTVKFKQKIHPGDTMIFKMRLNEPIRRGLCNMHGDIYVGGKIATEADMTAQLVKVADIEE